MDRATKLIVFGWCCAAATTIVYFSRAPWPAMPALALTSFAAMAIATAVDRRAVAVLLIVTYIFPIVIRTVTGLNYSPFSAVWTAGLLGAMAPDVVRTGWHVPARLRVPLVCWALTVVVGTFIVALREFDYTSTLVWSTGVANSSAGGWPSFVVTWALHTSLVLLSGMLWFDWLCGLSRDDYRRGVTLPLAASAGVMAAVALYQMFVDVSVLNPTAYGALRRASGTLMDANLCGVIAGAWIGGSVILLADAKTRYRIPLLMFCVGVLWLAVWASSSRTGFAMAVIVSLFAASAFGMRGIRKSAVLGLFGALATVAFIGLYAAGHVVGPLGRFAGLLPSFDRESVRVFASELWNRNGYGAVGDAVVRDHPWFGVGVGGFHVMQADFARHHGLPILAPDNAQNWYRQQLAEIGIVGSVSWMVWVVLFGSLVLRRRSDEAPAAHVARGIVVAFATISLVGVPTQEVPASMTFWTAAGWFLKSAGASELRVPSTWLRGALGAAVIVFIAGTAWTATGSLRVPVRAQRFGWPYSYGFYQPGKNQFGAGPGWTGRRAVAVFEVASQWMALTVTNDYRQVPGAPFLPTAAAGRTRALDVSVWCNGVMILDRRLETTLPIRIYLAAPQTRWVMIESRVDRTIPLRELGLPDDREIGVSVDWTVLPASPHGQADGMVATCSQKRDVDSRPWPFQSLAKILHVPVFLGGDE